MLCDPAPPRLSEFDRQVYQTVVPKDHYLRTVQQVVPWDDFHDLLAPYYSPDMGRPAELPVLMLKLVYLGYHHNLSDRDVIARAETDLAFRDFLQLPLRWKLPDPSSLCVFRGRVGSDGFRRIFRKLVAVAREHGVVKDPEDLNVDTYVPPPPTECETETYTPLDFEEDAQREVVACPAGHTSKYCYHDDQKQTTKYRFEAAVCRACPLLARCMKKAPRQHGRTVCKTDFQVEHDRVRQKAATPQYVAVRREHPKVERKLGEVMNRHGGRRARSRGRGNVLIQELMACTAANVKRLVRLLCAPAGVAAVGAGVV